MGKMEVEHLRIDGLCLIRPRVFSDARGYFTETYNQQDMEQAGLGMRFVQDNQSASVRGVLRGLHYQAKHPQGKLVRVLFGTVFDVAVDLRPGSKTFGEWEGVTLRADFRQFYIPEGFAHGFLVLSERAVFAYKCTDFYHPEAEAGIAWNDPAIGVCWPGVTGEYNGSASAEGYRLGDTRLLLSERDQRWPGIKPA